MADEDWKKRAGIGNISFSSGEDDDDDNRLRHSLEDVEATLSLDLEIENLRDEILSEYDQYGSTPPRTRIKIKNRDWDRRQSRKMESSGVKLRNAAGGRLARPRADRRNTVDCAILNQMIIEPSIDEKARTDKRSTQLLRDSERDMKMSATVNVVNRVSYNRASGINEDRADSMPSGQNIALIYPTNPTLIESCNRFMSVKSRPIGCRTSAPPSSFLNSLVKDGAPPTDVPQNRIDFHETFSNLIKLGSIEKQERLSKVIMSSEERFYQTEVNDLIWLELQAWHADRTLEQQDNFLCAARQGVSDLLVEIMNFRFQRHLLRSQSDTSFADSGIASDSTASAQDDGTRTGFCFGCFSMYCKDCLEVQSIALKQVEGLLVRLEAAECLYPSTKALGLAYPLYKSPEFTGRVKAMCLWYNMTKQHRLKLLILGKLLARLQSNQRHYHWPITETDSSSSSSVPENETIELTNGKTKKVQFADGGDGSATESANSEDSLANTTNNVQENYQCGGEFVNLYNLDSFTHVTRAGDSSTNTLYRKYMENVLKSRGLGKSLSFLHRLHNVVLRKAHITLENPYRLDFEESEIDVFDDEDVPIIEPPLEKEQEDELRRYGYWSKESKDLGLPTYISAFIFLSLIPLEVIHEFLKMRLETKPIKPNPLSLEQLIKELKEGLTLAMIHRERFKKHISTALWDKDNEMEKYINILDGFDTTLKKVFELYLDYAEQWVVIATPEGQRKSALDEEWRFTKLVCPMIPGQHSLAARKYCNIIERILENIGNRLKTRADELENHSSIFEENMPQSLKWQLLTICRETQQLFTTEREKCIKIMAFAKTLFRDIENIDFHRDHNDDNVQYRKNNNFICADVVDSIRVLKNNVLLFREKLTVTIERVQTKCDIKHITDMEDNEKQSVLSRIREILHQGYKFGFEYHKDLCRLYETKTENCKNSNCELKLSNAIIGFAKMWMKFVMERCERGRGVRPRWAAQGLDFLISACDPQNTNHLTSEEFEDLKSKMDACISHVIGSISEPERIKKSPRSRKSSPSPNTSARSSIPNINVSKSFQNQLSLNDGSLGSTSSLNADETDYSRKQYSNQVSINVPQRVTFTPVLRKVRIRDSVNKLDMELENNLRDRNLIGNVKELSNSDKFMKRARSVNFSWHRGIKIGQGRFGKVYTAVNNSTGELMAMKEIPIQPGETRTIKRVAEELRIFEGINHQHLVKYYGVEIHREELLIFMELCSEGTLESLVELSSGGLYEAQTRRFTAQLLSAVVELHKRGVVHRDIKTANIFLTSDGNCLKLGDFGSAVKIQAHTTLPGELKGYVGTQAYMAPEVFTKTNTDGHGRAADIWSVGCVVIEMCSGKRPWYQFDSNFQIMFKVGMGESPEVPESLSQEGQEFVSKCLQHDPKKRSTASELLQHNFCKVDVDDCKSCTRACSNADKEGRRSFRKNLRSK